MVGDFGVVGAICVGVLCVVGCVGDAQSDKGSVGLHDCVGVIQIGIGCVSCGGGVMHSGTLDCTGVLQDGSICVGVLERGIDCVKLLDDAGSVVVGVLQIGTGVSQTDTGLDGVLEMHTGCV